MKLRNKAAAVVAAGMLVLGVAGTAFATTGTDLLAGQVNLTMGDYAVNCDNFSDLSAGEIGVQFNLTSAGKLSDGDPGTLDATFSNPSSTPHKDNIDKADGNTVKWYVVITGDSSTVINSAHTDLDGNNLVISHVCFGGVVSSSTTESSSTESSTTETSTSFTGSVSDATDVPTEPNTATVGSGGPASGNSSWLFVAVIGALAGSVLVLTPARAKNKR